MNRRILIYHHPCLDGMGAALAAYLRFGDEIECVPASYSNPPPGIPDDAEVIVADISWDPEAMAELKARSKKLVVIDHHATALRRLQGQEGRIAHESWLVMDRSGCVLTYEYLHPGQPVPEFFLRIQDQDLWRWEYPENDEFIEALSALPMTLEAWIEAYEAGTQRLIDQGRSIVRYRNSIVESHASECALAGLFPGPGGGFYVAPVISAPRMLRNHMAHALMRRYPDAPFSAVYVDLGDGRREWSLRSGPDRVSVLEVAEVLGGGGHRDAAGCTEAYPGERIAILGGMEQFRHALTRTELREIVPCSKREACRVQTH